MAPPIDYDPDSGAEAESDDDHAPACRSENAESEVDAFGCHPSDWADSDDDDAGASGDESGDSECYDEYGDFQY